jgi:hypothetical protein
MVGAAVRQQWLGFESCSELSHWQLVRDLREELLCWLL